MHLLSQILLPVHLMLLSRSRDILRYFLSSFRRSDDACLESMRRNLEGVISEEDNQDLVAFRPRAVDRRQSQGRTVQGTHHRLHRAFLQCGVTFSDAAPLITVLFVDQKVLYLQIKTQGMIS